MSALPDELDPLVVARVLAAIHRYRVANGVGPPWSLIARLTGWQSGNSPGSELYRRMNYLRRARFVWFTTEPGSVVVTKRGSAWALDTLTSTRARDAA